MIRRHSRKRPSPASDDKYKEEKEYWRAKKEKKVAAVEEKSDSLLFPTIASCTSSDEEKEVKVKHKHRHRHHHHKSSLICLINRTRIQ